MGMATSRRIDIAFFDNGWVDQLVADGKAHYVLLFLFLVISCKNPAGIVEVNPRLWNFKLNPPSPFGTDDIFNVYGRRIRRIEGHPDKGIIVGFCDYQSTFSRNSRQWAWIEKDLEAVGLTYDQLQKMDDEQPELNLDIPPPPMKTRPKTEPHIRTQIPPRLEWVEDYCASRNNGIDARAFVDFYSARGWRVGKNTMLDWQAAVRTWEARRREERKPAPPTNTPVKNVVNVRRKF